MMDSVSTLSSKPRNRRETVDRSRWIGEGLTLLAEKGVAAVGVDVLAKRLGVTKGSFYWHFNDRNELLDGMLKDWRASCLEQIEADVAKKSATPREKLCWLWRVACNGRADNPGMQLEAALRQWALSDEKVATFLNSVEATRLKSVAELYREMGVDDPKAYSRLWYHYVVGRNTFAMTAPSADPRSDRRVMALLKMIEE